MGSSHACEFQLLFYLIHFTSLFPFQLLTLDFKLQHQTKDNSLLEAY